MPMLPSASSAVPHRPWPGSGSNTERCSAHAPAWRTRATAVREMSTPSTGIPRSASAMVRRPGPQPMSSTGPRQRRSSSSSARSGGPHQRSTWSGSARPHAVRSSSPASDSTQRLLVEADRPRLHACSRAAPAGARRAGQAENRGELAGPGGEPAPRRLTRHGHGVSRGVDVAQPRQLGDAQPGRMQPGPLSGTGVRRGHRHAAHQGGIRSPESEPPEPPVGRRAEPGVGGLPVHREQAGGELRRVHADQQRGSGYRGEGAGQALVEAAAALRHDVEPGRQPRSGLTVEHQHPAPRWRREHGVQRVGQRGLGQGGGLPGRARRHEAGLDPSGHRLLGDDEQGGA